MRLKTRDFGGGRGLWGARFSDRNGETCSIQDSSMATEPCVWLGRDEPDFPRMHLDQEMVAALVPLLQHFLRAGSLRTPEEGSEVVRAHKYGQCRFEYPHEGEIWYCTLPVGHTGPHVFYDARIKLPARTPEKGPR